MNNDNQKLDEIIKQEHKKVQYLKRIVNITMIILLFLIIILFIYPGVLMKNIKENKNNQINKSSIIENNIQENETRECKFSTVSIATQENVRYIIGKNKSENWEEVLQIDDEFNLLGLYKDKIYYYDNTKLAYIDLSKQMYEGTTWIKYKQYKVSDTGKLGILNISKATMINDTIYFEYNINTGGKSQTDGILSINIESKSFDDAIQIITEVEPKNWKIDINNKFIYYIQSEQGKPGSLLKYNLETKQKEKIFDNVKSFEVYENNVLYYTVNNSTTSTTTAISPVTYDLYIYNTQDKENKLIYASSVANISNGNLLNTAEFYNNDVYYKDDNKIIKYNNGARNIIYTYSSKDGGNYLNGFNFIDNNIIELIIENSDKRYLVNGNVSDNPIGVSNITVNMVDGTTKTFSRNDIVN